MLNGLSNYEFNYLREIELIKLVDRIVRSSNAPPTHRMYSFYKSFTHLSYTVMIL